LSQTGVAYGERPGRFTIGWAIAVAAPLLWLVPALLHPNEPQDDPGRWLYVHYAQLIVTPFLAFAVWKLLEGIRSQAATVSRVALAVWMIFFSAYDAAAGIATGLLARHTETVDVDGTEQSAVNAAVDWLLNDGLLPGGAVFLAIVATVAWPTTVIAGAVALHQAGARRLVVACLCLSALFAFHASYPAAIGLVFFVIAAVLWENQQAQPGPVRSTPSVTA